MAAIYAQGHEDEYILCPHLKKETLLCQSMFIKLWSYRNNLQNSVRILALFSVTPVSVYKIYLIYSKVKYCILHYGGN